MVLALLLPESFKDLVCYNLTYLYLFKYFCHQMAGASHLHVSHVSFVFSNCSPVPMAICLLIRRPASGIFISDLPIVEAEKRQHSGNTRVPSCLIMSYHVPSVNETTIYHNAKLGKLRKTMRNANMSCLDSWNCASVQGLLWLY